MRSWKIAAMALEGLRRTRLRVTLTTLGVAIASGALVSMVAFAIGLQRQVEMPFRLLNLLNNIRVMPKDGDEAKDAPVLDDAALEQIGQLSGVAAAYPEIRVQGLKLRHGDKSETAIAVAMPREASLFGVAEEILIAGRFFTEGKEPEAIVGIQLVRALGFDSPQAAVGAKLTLEAAGLSPEPAKPGETKSFTFQRKELTATIVGVYDVPMILPGPARRGVLLPVEIMKQIPGIRLDATLKRLTAGANPVTSGYLSATVRVRDPADIPSLEEQIRQMGFKTRTVMSDLKQMRAFFIFLQVLLGSIGTVALVVAALGIVNTLLMSVLERFQEIGIYKAIGASKGDLVVLFLTEAATIGLLGGLGGLALGRSVSWVLEIAVNVYAKRQGLTEHLQMFVFPAWLLAAAMLFAIAASILAGVYPALRAARVDPIRALRRE